MLVTILTLPAVLFLIRGILILKKNRTRVSATAIAEIIVTFPWLTLMLIDIYGLIYSTIEKVVPNDDGRYRLAYFVVQVATGIAGKYYLPVMALTAAVCGFVNLKSKKAKTFAVDMLFAAVFVVLWLLCRSGDIFAVWGLFDKEA